MEAMCEVENEGLIVADAAPSTSEWSTIVLPNTVPFVLEVCRYIQSWHLSINVFAVAYFTNMVWL